MAVNNPLEGSFDMIQFQLLSQDTGTHFEDEEIQVGLLEHLRFFFPLPLFFYGFPTLGALGRLVRNAYKSLIRGDGGV